MGLFVLAAIGTIAAGLIRTSRTLSVSGFELFMRADIAQDLTQDTRVFLQGLEIGRLREINPVVDTATGQLRFVARLVVDTEFEDGTTIALPPGTRALISKETPIADPVVALEIPKDLNISAEALQPGDTIESFRREDVLNVLSEVAEDFAGRLREIIDETRTMIEVATGVMTEVRRQADRTAPALDTILSRASAALLLTEGLIADIQPRVGIMQDSVLATISDTRRTLAGFDSLRTVTQDLAVENTAEVEQIIENMRRTSVILSNFADQVSRRPTRILTGVTPPPIDSAEDDR